MVFASFHFHWTTCKKKSLVDEYRRPSITFGANYVVRDANYDEILIRALTNARKMRG